MQKPGNSSLIEKRKMNQSIEIDTADTDAVDEAKQRSIEKVAEGVFEARYELGDEVMPSTNSHMEVNYATRRSDGEVVVIKHRFKPHCFKSKSDEANWRKNTEFMLNMPNSKGIAKLYEVLEDNHAFYIVTELVEGMDLFEMLDNSGNVEIGVAREIIYQILEAVQTFHALGAVHKDLKLENVVVDPQVFQSLPVPAPARLRRNSDPALSLSGITPRSLKVIDFDTVEQQEKMATPRAKEVLGTNQYIPQEAYAGKYSPSSDMFSVGVIAYRLLTGRFPYKDKIFDDKPGENWVGSPQMRVIRKRLQTIQIKWDYTVFQKFPDALELVQQMLSVEESKRPSAKEALAHRWFTGSSQSAPQDEVLMSPPQAPSLAHRSARRHRSIVRVTDNLRRLRGWVGEYVHSGA